MNKSTLTTYLKRLLRLIPILLYFMFVVFIIYGINTDYEDRKESMDQITEIFNYLDQPRYQQPADILLDSNGNTAVHESDKHHYSTWTFFYYDNYTELDKTTDIFLRSVTLPDGREEEIWLRAKDFVELAQFRDRYDAHKFGVRTIWSQDIDDFEPVNTHYMCIENEECTVICKLNQHALEDIIADLEANPVSIDESGYAINNVKVIEDDIFLPDGRRFQLSINLDTAQKILRTLLDSEEKTIYYGNSDTFNPKATYARSVDAMYEHERQLVSEMQAKHEDTLTNLQHDKDTRNAVAVYMVSMIIIVIAIVLFALFMKWLHSVKLKQLSKQLSKQ